MLMFNIKSKKYIQYIISEIQAIMGFTLNMNKKLQKGSLNLSHNNNFAIVAV